jgi:hypothetical protein
VDRLREAELRSLDPEGRLLLGALAVVAPASLSVEELGGITEVSEAQLALAELEGRGLVVREGHRYALAPEEQGPLKRLLASIDMVDRVLRGFIDIAEDGRLTLADLDAVLGLTRIAAETGRWEELLRLAESAETTLSTTRRVKEWKEIVEHRLEAAQALGDSQAARRAQRELDGLTGAGGQVGTATAVLAAAAAAAAVALGAGYLVGNQSSEESDGSSGKRAKTVTESETETGAAETVTETVTETETETTTVFTTRTPTVD